MNMNKIVQTGAYGVRTILIDLCYILYDICVVDFCHLFCYIQNTANLTVYCNNSKAYFQRI